MITFLLLILDNYIEVKGIFQLILHALTNVSVCEVRILGMIYMNILF